MKKFLSLALISLSILFASCNKTPNCTMRQNANGKYTMINDNCKNCDYMNIQQADGTMRTIGLAQASQMLMSPQAFGSVSPMYGNEGSMNSLLLYHLLFNNQSYNASNPIYNRYNQNYERYRYSPNFSKFSNNYKSNNKNDNAVESKGFSKPSETKSNGFLTNNNKSSGSTYKVSPQTQKSVFKSSSSSGFSKPSSYSSYKPSSGFSKPSSGYRSSSGFKK